MRSIDFPASNASAKRSYYLACRLPAGGRGAKLLLESDGGGWREAWRPARAAAGTGPTGRRLARIPAEGKGRALHSALPWWFRCGTAGSSAGRACRFIRAAARVSRRGLPLCHAATRWRARRSATRRRACCGSISTVTDLQARRNGQRGLNRALTWKGYLLIFDASAERSLRAFGR